MLVKMIMKCLLMHSLQKYRKKVIASIKILAASEGYIMLYCILFFIDCLLIFAQSAFFYFYFKVSGECK